MTGLRRPASLESIVQYWRGDGAEFFPLLQVDAVDWRKPFCFRCGWRAPRPRASKIGPWRLANGWLERAHLHDHWNGGPGTPDNLVPLCVLCHRRMPEFHDSREPAIDWVKAQEHDSCPRWWQKATDDKWSEGDFGPCPGSTSQLKIFLSLVERHERMESGWRAAERGDMITAIRQMRLTGVDEATAALLVAGALSDGVAAT